MHAVVSRRTDPTPRLEPAEPVPPGPDEVRVQVAAAGFTLFDAFSAANHDSLGLPDVVGHGFDFSGTVAEVGAAVRTPAPGDRVAGVHAEVPAPARAHATEVVVPAADLAAVPEALSLVSAAAVPLNALTARQGLDHLGPARGRLLVTGAAGSIGAWAVALAKRDGWRVTGLTRAGTETLAVEAGADDVLTDLPDQDYDAVIDLAALGADALGAVATGGRYVGVKPGRAPDSVRDIAVSTVLHRPDGAVLADLLALAAEGVVPIRIAATRPLASVAEAYEAATSAPGSSGRWLLVP